MKLIMRADDLGFSEGVNYGILKSIADGMITSAALMPNMDASEHGYDLVKDLDIALGQHSHISAGKPVCNPQLIPSLVNDKGEFYTTREIAERETDTIDVKECELEIEAQLQRFRDITGKDPDYFEGHAVFSGNFFIALENVAKRNNLFFDNPSVDKEWEKEFGIYGFGFAELDEKGLYDPQKYMEDHLEDIKTNECSIGIFHPGYLDQYILDHSSFTLIRTMECEFLCSDWIKQWIKENNIQLVDFRNYKD